MPPKAKLELSNFHGTISLQNFHKTLDGRSVVGYTGRVTIIPGDEIAKGKELRGKDANWIARIEGALTSVNVPGCQVHAVHTHPEDFAVNGDYYLVP